MNRDERNVDRDVKKDVAASASKAKYEKDRFLVITIF